MKKRLTTLALVPLLVAPVVACSSGGSGGSGGKLTGCNLTASIFTSVGGAYTAVQTDLNPATAPSAAQAENDAGQLVTDAASWYGSGSPLARMFATFGKDIQQLEATDAAGNLNGTGQAQADAAHHVNDQIQAALNACGL